MKNKILLVDMDNFFASVEEIGNPSYIGKPLVVGGRVKDGVVAAASPAAKKLGIKAAMPTYKAKEICPELIVVQSHMSKYMEYSKKVHKILKTFTANVEKASIDEWYIDLSNKKDFFNRDVEEMARTIQYKIEQKLGLKCSIGVSYNKFLAKMASGLAKPNGVFIFTKDNIKEYLWPMSIGDMFMVGKKSEVIMKEQLGINTIGDLANYKDKKLLHETFGKVAQYYISNANGQDILYVEPDRPMKSMSSSTTYPDLITNQQQLLKEIDLHFEIVYTKLINENYLTNSITVKIGDKKAKDPLTCSFEFHTQDKEILYDTVLELFNKLDNGRDIKYVCITFSNLEYKFNYIFQESMFKSKKEDIITEINSIFGKEIINFASKKIKK